MTESEFVVLITAEMKSLATEFVPDDYINALGTAKRETGFVVPNSVDFQIHWLIQRAKRHMFFSLVSQNSVKFKIKQINLDQKFTHLLSLVRDMDEAFKEIQSDPDYYMSAVSSSNLFGHKIDAGFSYDPVTGKDTTYFDENEVIITPTGTQE